MSDTVLIHYSASSDASFKGVIDTGITKSSWAKMSEEERNQAIDEVVYDLVSIGVEAE